MNQFLTITSLFQASHQCSKQVTSLFSSSPLNMSFVTSKPLVPSSSVYRKQRRFLKTFLITLLIIGISYIPVRLSLATIFYPTPQGILTLGGRESREEFTAEFARSHPNLKVWISSGAKPEKSQLFFNAAGVESSRVQFDQRATDTVTNFTTLVDDFEREDIHHLYVITSDYHMPRAQAIATVVLGSRGIRFTPITIASGGPPESSLRVVRDILRSFMWLLTNHTGAGLRYHPFVEALNHHVS